MRTHVTLGLAVPQDAESACRLPPTLAPAIITQVPWHLRTSRPEGRGDTTLCRIFAIASMPSTRWPPSVLQATDVV